MTPSPKGIRTKGGSFYELDELRKRIVELEEALAKVTAERETYKRLLKEAENDRHPF